MHLNFEFKILGYSESFLKHPMYCLLKKIYLSNAKMCFTLKKNYVTNNILNFFNQSSKHLSSVFHQLHTVLTCLLQKNKCQDSFNIYL